MIIALGSKALNLGGSGNTKYIQTGSSPLIDFFWQV
jgi:hypothetical protein